MRKLAVVISLAAVVAGSLGSALPAGAAFPGSNGRIVFVTEAPGKPVIASMTSSGSDIQLLTTGGQSPTAFGDQNPRWSPGGKFVVFTRYYAQGYGDIWVMNADGTGQKRLTSTTTVDDDWPSFSPDGARIVFASDRHGNYEIYSMKVDGTDVKRLTNNPAIDWLPAWSPTNTRIAFSSDRAGGGFDTWTMNSDGSGLAKETSGGPVGDVDQVWSPDGAYIYFARVSEELTGQIHRVNVATNAVELTDAQAFTYGQPAVSPESTSSTFQFAFTEFADDGAIDILVVTTTPTTSAGQNITYGYGAHAYMPDWQPIPTFPLVDARFSPFKLDIEWVFAEGITVGCSPERYCANDPVTREQMATFLVRALGLSGTAPDVFTDDEGSSHEANINLLAQAGITAGCGPSSFCPKAPVARDQMASFLARALGLPTTATDFFTDDQGNTHEININRLAASGITTGCSPTTYCPLQTVTRGQMAALLHRAFD